jgi:SAM-dependent methyltransferase
MAQRNLDKAAQCGEPSYVWRAGQDRRLAMILDAAGPRLAGRVLENGCGVGMYVRKLSPHAAAVIGLEYDFERALEAHGHAPLILNAAGEGLPFPAASFDLVLSHEVLEHVQDDALAMSEIARVLAPGGRALVFTPNRGYPFETHGIYWRGRYRFGNIPLVNWLPRPWRDRLAPHVRIYTRRDMRRLVSKLPLRVVKATIVFGAYDNIIARFPRLGKTLRAALQFLERTPLQILGLSHFWILEKQGHPAPNRPVQTQNLASPQTPKGP